LAFEVVFDVFERAEFTALPTAFAAALAMLAAAFAAFAAAFAMLAAVLAIVLALFAMLALFALLAMLVFAVSPQAMPKAPSAKSDVSAMILLI
jgi:fatty acid desaturase